jgi:hypothetical protein
VIRVSNYNFNSKLLFSWLLLWYNFEKVVVYMIKFEEIFIPNLSGKGNLVYKLLLLLLFLGPLKPIKPLIPWINF